MRAFVLLSCLAIAAARPEAGYSYNRPSSGGFSGGLSSGGGHSSGGGGFLSGGGGGHGGSFGGGSGLSGGFSSGGSFSTGSGISSGFGGVLRSFLFVDLFNLCIMMDLIVFLGKTSDINCIKLNIFVC